MALPTEAARMDQRTSGSGEEERFLSRVVVCLPPVQKRQSGDFGGPEHPCHSSCPTALPAHPQAQRHAPSLGNLKTRGSLRPLCSHLKQVTQLSLGPILGGKPHCLSFKSFSFPLRFRFTFWNQCSLVLRDGSATPTKQPSPGQPTFASSRSVVGASPPAAGRRGQGVNGVNAQARSQVRTSKQHGHKAGPWRRAAAARCQPSTRQTDRCESIGLSKRSREAEPPPTPL